MEAFPNGSLALGNRMNGERKLIRQPTGCGDMALPANPDNPLEGPIYISCIGKGEADPLPDNPFSDDSSTDDVGFVSKCCPRNQVRISNIV